MSILSDVLSHKEETDIAIGREREKLQRCGPKGNHSVESRLDYLTGQSNGLQIVIDYLIEEGLTTT